MFKNTKKTADNQPDYNLSTKIGDTYKDIGAGFIKQSPKGSYVSFGLSKPYNERQGYCIVTEDFYNKAVALMNAKTAPDGSPYPEDANGAIKAYDNRQGVYADVPKDATQEEMKFDDLVNHEDIPF